MARDLSTPLAALTHAMAVIEAYQYDIRNSKDSIGLDLEARGFCQGWYYKETTLALYQALQRFQREADAALEPRPNPYPLDEGISAKPEGA